MVVNVKGDRIAGCMLEKDWFYLPWCELFASHQRITRPQGVFHIVNQSHDLPVPQLERLIDAAIHGQVVTIDLREYSLHKHLAPKVKRP